MTEALKSTSITNFDAFPPIRPITGEGGEAMVRAVNDFVTFTTGEAATSTYRLCRFPRNAHVKHVLLYLGAEATTFACDIDVAWSDATNDTTQVVYQGTIPQISSADNKLFGAAVDLHDTLEPTDFINGNLTNFPAGSSNQPLWQVLGYVNDPGGYFDLLLKNTSTNSGSEAVFGEVQYTLG
jgi:hypothetical protein